MSLKHSLEQAIKRGDVARVEELSIRIRKHKSRMATKKAVRHDKFVARKEPEIDTVRESEARKRAAPWEGFGRRD